MLTATALSYEEIVRNLPEEILAFIESDESLENYPDPQGRIALARQLYNERKQKDRELKALEIQGGSGSEY